jgi:hypothetical protein
MICESMMRRKFFGTSFYGQTCRLECSCPSLNVQGTKQHSLVHAPAAQETLDHRKPNQGKKKFRDPKKHGGRAAILTKMRKKARRSS